MSRIYCYGGIFAAHRAAEKTRPEILRIRAEDRELLPEPYPKAYEVGKFYEAHHVERLRKEKWSRVKQVTLQPTDLVAVEDLLKRHEFLYEEYIPAPEARARADEIIQAHDRWYVGYDKKPRGFRAAERRQRAALDKEDKLARKIAATRTSTVAGLKAKLRCIEAEQIFDDAGDQPITVSIMRDLSAMAA